MRVGVLDLLSMPSSHWLQVPYRLLLTKQYAAIMPQAVAVWCEQLGHEVHYATYTGAGDPTRRLPAELDIVFISSFTHVSPLAYAVAKLYRARGTLTVLGGPHARSFPEDCLRFFDLVVGDCDKELVGGILAGDFESGSQISSATSLQDLPSLEERMPFIRRSAYLLGHRYPATTIPLLASSGCPYSCDFCCDWNNPYRLLPDDHLRADLAYLSRHLPGVRITFHDPNLATGWEPVLSALESVPPERRSPHIVEASLASLRQEERLRRLRETRCLFVGVGIESWAGYGHKAGAGRLEGADKVPRVVDEFRQVADYVPYLQANFVFGLDVDHGDEPGEMTRSFMDQTPYVWPVVNIPQPFGHTPLFDAWQRDDRLLTTMPFYFYQMPFLVMRPKHYEAMDYYTRVIDLLSHATSKAMLRRRLDSTNLRLVKLMHLTRTLNVRRALTQFRRTLDTWRHDHQVIAFHRRETLQVPAVYERILDRALGPLRGILTRADLTPVLPGA